MVNGYGASEVVALMVDPAMIDPRLRCLLHLREICRQLILPGEREFNSLQGLCGLGWSLMNNDSVFRGEEEGKGAGR